MPSNLVNNPHFPQIPSHSTLKKIHKFPRLCLLLQTLIPQWIHPLPPNIIFPHCNARQYCTQLFGNSTNFFQISTRLCFPTNSFTLQCKAMNSTFVKFHNSLPDSYPTLPLSAKPHILPYKVFQIPNTCDAPDTAATPASARTADWELHEPLLLLPCCC